MPVLFLTGLADGDHRVEGLAAGGDDDLTKPFHVAERRARIAALTRRRTPLAAVTMLRVRDLARDLLARTARRQGQVIALQTKEYRLLAALMRNAGRVLTPTMLLERIWNFSVEPHTTVPETRMRRLRARIDTPFDVALIHTIRNTGHAIHGPG